MKNPFKNLGFIFCIAFMAESCDYSNEDDLLNNPLTGCDTLNVTYSGVVQPIIQNNCNECHSASVATAGVVLEGYSNLKPKADSGLLLGVINHAPGFKKMPFGRAKLAECDIAKIRKWIEAGSPNN